MEVGCGVNDTPQQRKVPGKKSQLAFLPVPFRDLFFLATATAGRLSRLVKSREAQAVPWNSEVHAAPRILRLFSLGKVKVGKVRSTLSFHIIRVYTP